LLNVSYDPTRELDAKVRRELRSALRDIHEELGLTSLFVTHDHEEAFTLANRVAVLKDGALQQYGRPTEIATNPANEFVREFVS
jgi:sulfate transport system ATP-binding protein